MKKGSQQATKPPTTTARVPAVFVSRVTLLMQLCWWLRRVPVRTILRQGLLEISGQGTVRPAGLLASVLPTSLVVPSDIDTVECLETRIDCGTCGFFGPFARSTAAV
jgi:hypothetical protein